MRPAEQEPTLLWKIFFRDTDKNRGAGFSGQQVVASVMKTVLFRIESNRHQLAVAIEQKLEIHFVGEFSSLGGNPAQVGDQSRYVLLRCQKLIAKPLVQTSLVLRHRRDRPIQLADQLVDEFRQLLEGDAIHQREVENAVFAQSCEFRRTPRSIFAHRPLNTSKSGFGILSKPACLVKALGLAVTLPSLFEGCFRNIEHRFQPVIRSVLPFASGEKLS